MEGIIRIPLLGKIGEGKETLLSIEDQLLVANKKLSLCRMGYVMIWKDSKTQYLHRVIAGAILKDEFVDHINGDKLDNRRENLRICTQQQNLCNRKKRADSKQKYKGIRQVGKKFQALINIDGKKKIIGFYTNEEEAARAYNEKALKLYGNFANINIIN